MKKVPDLNELLNFPWVHGQQVHLRPQINATSPWLSSPMAFLISDEQERKNIQFLSENDMLLGVNIPCFDILK